MLMQSLAVETQTPQEVFDTLMATRRGDPVEETLARMLASWSLGQGAMPVWLGLSESGFKAMMAFHFPDYDLDEIAGSETSTDSARFDEMEDLHKLLMQNRSGSTQSDRWMVDIVIAGCMGNDHLWQDLGLWNRADLSKLMLDNFEPLAKRNNKDMKWKKFLYKQLCETEGIYTCRAPSCEVCADYDDCFGPEE